MIKLTDSNIIDEFLNDLKKSNSITVNSYDVTINRYDVTINRYDSKTLYTKLIEFINDNVERTT